MSRNHKLAESILEMNFGEFRRILEYKAKWYGKQLIIIGRYYPSSKLCNKCSYINKDLTLKDREWVCPQCGEHHDRDINASINILKEGERIIGCSTTEFTLVDYPTMADKVEIPLKSSDRLKQEVKTE